LNLETNRSFVERVHELNPNYSPPNGVWREEEA